MSSVKNYYSNKYYNTTNISSGSSWATVTSSSDEYVRYNFIEPAMLSEELMKKKAIAQTKEQRYGFNNPYLKKLAEIDPATSVSLLGNSVIFIGDNVKINGDDANACAVRNITLNVASSKQMTSLPHKGYYTLILHNVLSSMDEFMVRANYIKEALLLLSPKSTARIIVIEEKLPEEEVKQVFHFVGGWESVKPNHVSMDAVLLVVTVW